MKLLKRILLVVGGLLVLAIAAVMVKFYVLAPKSRPALDLHAPTTPAAIARGEYLATHVAGCVNCHSKVDDDQPGDGIVPGTLGGGRDFSRPTGDSMIKIRAPNITSDKTHGLGAATDGEIVRALREGIGKDGRNLFPMMPYTSYAKVMSDDDALAIVAYLRTLPPIASSPPKIEIGFPVSMFVRTLPQPLATPAGPPPTDPLAHGQWLMTMASCADCHDSFDERHERIPGKHMAGGAKFDLPKGTVYAANITPDQATGIGAYSDEDLMRVLTEGVSKSGKPLYVMPFTAYRGMTDEDKKHLILALRALPPASNQVPASTVK